MIPELSSEMNKAQGSWKNPPSAAAPSSPPPSARQAGLERVPRQPRGVCADPCQYIWQLVAVAFISGRDALANESFPGVRSDYKEQRA